MNKMKRQKSTRFAALGAVLLAFLLSSCASAPELPGWISDYPSEGRYFIGIGSSNTGDQATDRDMAREEALSNIAASISTTIESELEVETGEETTGEEYARVRRRINEKVHQTLDGAEVADSFYSPSEGYWIYMRFPKEALERQKREIASRVEEIAAPLFDGSPLTVAQSLGLIERSHAVLLDSPYFAYLRGTLGGNKRVLIDILEETAARMLGVLDLTVSPERLEGEAGEEAVLELAFHGSDSTGRLPLKALYEGETIFSGVTDNRGIYSAAVDLSSLPIGRGVLQVNLDLSAIGINSSDYFLSLPRPSTDFPFEVRPLTMGLAVEYQDDVDVEGIESMAAALFSASGLPFALVPQERGSEYLLRCRLIVEDFPRYKENSLEISQARLIIQIEREGDVLYTYESGAMKDGGLTLAQAHERTIKKLFAKIGSEQPYLENIVEVLPVRTAR
jgi:LPP20 lipoprotein